MRAFRLATVGLALCVIGCGPSSPEEPADGEETSGAEAPAPPREAAYQIFRTALLERERDEVDWRCSEREGNSRLKCAFEWATQAAIVTPGDVESHRTGVMAVVRGLDSAFADRRLPVSVRLRALFEAGHLYESLIGQARLEEARVEATPPPEPDPTADPPTVEPSTPPAPETPVSERLECLAVSRYLLMSRGARSVNMDRRFVERGRSWMRSLGDARLRSCSLAARGSDPSFHEYEPGELDAPPGEDPAQSEASGEATSG